MAELWTNNAGTVLATGISAAATVLSVAPGDGVKFPNPINPDFFYCTLDDGVNLEIVLVTARSTDAFTIVRAQQGTVARAWIPTNKVELRLTRASLENLASVDTLLNQAVSVVSQALSVETAARVVKDDVLSQGLSVVSQAVSVETAARIAKDDTLSQAISVVSQQVSVLSQAHSVLSQTVSAISQLLSTLRGGATSTVLMKSAAGDYLWAWKSVVAGGVGSVTSAQRDSISNAASNALSVANAASNAASIVSQALSNEISNRVSLANAVSIISQQVSVLSQAVSGISQLLSTLRGGATSTVLMKSAAGDFAWKWASTTAGGVGSVTSAQRDVLSQAISVISQQLSVLSQAHSVLSSQVSTVSVAVTSVDTRVNTVSNLVSALTSAHNVLSNLVSDSLSVGDVASNLLSNLISQHTSLVNRVSANSVIGGTGSVTSTEASAISAQAASAINVVSQAVSVISQKLSVLSSQVSNLTSAHDALSNTVSNALSAGDVASNKISIISQQVSVLSQTVSAISQLLSTLRGGATSTVLMKSAAGDFAWRWASTTAGGVGSVTSAQRDIISNAASNALSVANAASNAASIVSNALSNEISNRTSAVNVVSQAVSVLSQQVSVISQQLSVLSQAHSVLSQAVSVLSNAASNALSVANAASNAASIVSNALSNEISNRTSADNVLSQAISVISQQLSVLSQAHSVLSSQVSNLTSAHNILSNLVSNALSAGDVVSNQISALSAAGQRIVLQNVDTSAVSAGAPVYLFTSAATFRRADADAGGATGDVIGLVYDAAIAVSATGNVQINGVVTLTTGQWDSITGQSGGLTIGSKYYLDSTAGLLRTTPPATGVVRPVGIAISTTRLALWDVTDDVTSALSVLSQAISVVSTAASNALSVANAASNAASIVSNALSNEISNRNSANNAVSAQAASVASVVSAAVTSVDARLNTVSQQVSVLSQALSVLSQAVSVISAGIGLPQMRVVANAQLISATAFTNVSGMSVSVTSAATYRVEGRMLFTVSTVSGLAFGFTYPGGVGPGVMTMEWASNQAGAPVNLTSTTYALTRINETAMSTVATAHMSLHSNVLSATTYELDMYGLVKISTTAGAIQLQARASVAGSGVQILAGTYLQAFRVL